jgi:hypothetical protein
MWPISISSFISFFIEKKKRVRTHLHLSDRNQNENTAEARFQGHGSE